MSDKAWLTHCVKLAKATGRMVACDRNDYCEPDGTTRKNWGIYVAGEDGRWVDREQEGRRFHTGACESPEAALAEAQRLLAAQGGGV